MKRFWKCCALLLTVAVLASLPACKPQSEAQPSDEMTASVPTQSPTEESRIPATQEPESLPETPSDVIEETEPYIIDDEDFEIFSESNSTYWYIGSKQTIKLEDFGLEITLPDGWADRVEIIRNTDPDYLELFIGNSELMRAYENMDREEQDEEADIRGSYGYLDWILFAHGIRKDNYDEVEYFDKDEYCVYLGENEKFRFYLSTSEMHNMDCSTIMITRQKMIREQGQEYYDNLIGDLVCTVEQAKEILKVL